MSDTFKLVIRGRLQKELDGTMVIDRLRSINPKAFNPRDISLTKMMMNVARNLEALNGDTVEFAIDMNMDGKIVEDDNED